MYTQKQKTIYYFIVCSLLNVVYIPSSAQYPTPKIEVCPCLVKADPPLILRCGYLVAPENKKDPKNKNRGKIPFVFARQPGIVPKAIGAKHNNPIILLPFIDLKNQNTSDNKDKLRRNRLGIKIAC